ATASSSSGRRSMRTPKSLKTDVWRSYLRSRYLCTNKSSGWIVHPTQASTPAAAGHRQLAEGSSAKTEKEEDNGGSSVPAEGCKPSRSVQSISGDEHTSDPISRGALRRPSPFTEGERELIAAYVSGLNHCRYCHGVHSATAELLGIKRELVDSRIDIDGADVDPKMRPVLRYARKLTQQPSSLTQADADAIFAAGWEGPPPYLHAGGPAPL